MPGILDVFQIIFTSNAKEIKAGHEEVEAASKKLEHGLEGVGEAATEVGEHFLDMAKEAAGALVALAGIGMAAEEIMHTAEIADELKKTSDALEVNIEDLSAWNDAVREAGGPGANFTETLKHLTAGMAQVDVLGKSRMLPFFQELGVKMLDAQGKIRPVMNLLPELAEKFHAMGAQKSFGFGEKLGLDQGTIMLLQRGRNEVDEVIRKQKELGVVTKEQAEIAEKFNDQLEETRHAFRSMWTDIGSSLLPALGGILNVVEKGVTWLRENKYAVEGFFGTIAAVVMYTYVPAMIEAAVATLAATWPILAIIAAFALLAAGVALVYDDIMGFVHGNDSLIGSIVNAVKHSRLLMDVIHHVGAKFEWTKNKIEDFIKSSRFLQGVIAGIKMVFEGWWDILSTIITGVEKLGGLLGKVGSWVGGKISQGVTAYEEHLEAGQAAYDNANAAHAAAQTSTSISTSNTSRASTVSIDKVEIHTQATDAAGMAGSAAGALEQHMRAASSHFDDGVAG